MLSLEVNDAVVLEQKDILEKALSTNPKTQKALQKLIRQVIAEARDQMVAAARGSMSSDPRGSVHGIRRAVYKKILGANINIYDSRKAGAKSTYEPPRKLQPKQRGGNRVARGSRTDTIMHYGPHDRQFILRFLNDGTSERTAGSRGGRLGGNRGSIAGRHWFRNRGENVLRQAVDNLANLIDTELENILNKKK